MTHITKLSSLFIGISFSLRLHTPIAFGICIFTGILLMLFDNKQNIKKWLVKGYKHKVFPLFCISFICILISSIISNYPSRSFPVFIYLIAFMLFSYFIFCNFRNKPESLVLLIKFLFISVCFSTILVFSYNINQIESIFEPIKEVRKYKGFVNLLTVLVFLCPLIEKCIGGKKIFFSYFLIPLIFPLAFISNCNSAFLGLIGGFITLLFFELLRLVKNKKNRVLILLSVLFFSSVTFLNIIPKYDKNSPISEIDFLVPTNIIDAHRQIMWAFTKSELKENLIFGIGPDTSNFIEESQKEIGHNQTGTMFYISSHPHNFFLEILLEIGVFGTVSFLLLILFVIIYFLNKYYNPFARYLIFFNGYFWTASMVNFSFWSAWWQGSYFLIQAILFAIIYNKHNRCL